MPLPQSRRSQPAAGPLLRRRLARVGAVAVLTAVAAGCGGGSTDSNDEQSEAEAWADDVCSSVGEWTDAIAETQSTLGDTANLSANSVKKALRSLATATETFVADLKSVGPPDTEAGDEAEQQLSVLSDQLAEQAAIVKEATTQDAGTSSELLAQVSTVTGALSAMLGDTLTAVDNIRQLDGAAELEGAFKSAPSCQDLGPSESPSGS